MKGVLNGGNDRWYGVEFKDLVIKTYGLTVEYKHFNHMTNDG